MKPTERSFPVIGMHCTACAQKIEQALSKVSGIDEANVLYNERMLNVSYKEEMITLEEIVQRVKEIGFELITADTGQELNERRRKAQEKELRRMRLDTIGAWIATIIMMVMMWWHLPHTIHKIGMLLPATAVFFIFSSRFHIAALKQIRHGIFSMDTLVSLSTTVSFIAGNIALWHDLLPAEDAHLYFDATTMIPAFVLLGKWLEQKATIRTGDAIASILNRSPKWAMVMRDGVATELPIELIKVGDKIRVRAGETIPVDGVVIKGTSTVDEKLISGEPIPAEKVIGSTVYAGTINGTGAFTMEAQSIGSETVLGNIIETIRRAETERPPIRRIADKIASIFVPVVGLLSLLTFFLWYFLGESTDANAVSFAIRCAVSVLVISCPCALGLATPTALTVLIGETAKRQILIRKAATMEVLPRITTVFLDKTGTITAGMPEVVAQEWYVPSEEQPFYQSVLYTLERESTHPLAEAICSFFADSNKAELAFGSINTIVGKGIEAELEGKNYRIGNADFVGTSSSSLPGTHVYMSCNESLIVHLTIEDRVTDESRQAIADMQKMGLKVVLLTGDNKQAARHAAQISGIQEYHAGLLPSEKLAIVQTAIEKGEQVAMIGDGINDSEALSYAHVSASFASGSDIAISVADITFLKHDLRLFPQSIRMMHQGVKTIRLNFFWALIYNALAIPIAAGVLYPAWGIFITPALSGAAMAFSSLSVVSNSLFLKKRLHHK
ncbi:heavy metal translocating P-type ATPase [Porphyromonas circumdentaria]|uniref:Cu2+-exporting ATPase n=1 Tax=Porphyromonas circumdentaria TaxID=29524 RepID=A0A1T4PZR9_9PORP|nr:heavy metal translocating P-type ATPase [Porphyromonas circumdentaria]MBB6276584.1 Cu2+-exporting ATPase [Porphyromonas circumdentaria]MDO4723063.1 heavy metal translocating P-type ATPase [Porphyromonas circumdentaria]SJZ97070.1 Cu2+-exporting ATPase [Porphyromonas circumdentaria]